MHRVMVKAVDMLATTEADATAIDATDDAAADAAGMNTRTRLDSCTNVLTGPDASNVRAAKAADMTDTNATQTADVSTAAKATDMTATEATAHTATVAAAAESTAATARHCLPGKQARCQQRSRQNGHHLSHHLLHSVIDWRAPLEGRATPKLLMSQR
jgi:hypothetical protein